MATPATQDKPVSVFTAGNDAMRAVIIEGSAMLCGTLQAGVKVTDIANQTLDYAKAANAAWAAEGMSNFDAQSRAYIQQLHPDFVLPPQIDENGNVISS